MSRMSSSKGSSGSGSGSGTLAQVSYYDSLVPEEALGSAAASAQTSAQLPR